MDPCELEISDTPFSDATIVKYDLELPPLENNIGLKLIYDDFTIPYILGTIPSSPESHKITYKANNNV